MSKCNHPIKVDFTKKQVYVCEKCKLLHVFKVNDASLDIDTTTIEGQKEARKKLKEYSLSETIDIERWVYHLDRVIPLKEQNIREMVGRVTRIDNYAVYYLDTTYFDPTLKRTLRQEAFIAKKPIEVYYTELVETCANVRRDLTTDMMKEGMIFEYTQYIHLGRVCDPPKAMLPTHMLETTREVERIHKAKTEELNNVIQFTMMLDDSEPSPKFQLNWPNTLLVLGIIAILWIALYYII